MKVKTYDEEIAYITRKLQALINAGYVIRNSSGKPITSAHQAATDLYSSASKIYTLTMPDDHKCCCIKWSKMAIKLIKPYIKNKFIIEQLSSNAHYMLVESSMKEQLQQLQHTDDIKIVDTINEIEFTKSTLPTYTNRASLFTVKAAPSLTAKEIKKILTLSEHIIANQNNYFLLSNSITHIYNAPMTIIRLLGENVISLNALNLTELILTYATNSSAVFRNKSDDIKSFIIPFEFFSNEDFELNQSIDEISSSLAELKAIGLISSYSFNSETISFEIVSNVISKSIKQYSYTQPIGYYKSLNLHQQEYCYTFVNYLQYVSNVKYTTKSEVAENVEVQDIKKAEKLKICLSSLLYNLEQDEYVHDHTRIAQVLHNLYEAGRKAFLLKESYRVIDTSAVRYLLTHKDKLHEFFILDTEEKMKVNFEAYKELVTLVNLDIKPSQYRKLIQR